MEAETYNMVVTIGMKQETEDETTNIAGSIVVKQELDNETKTDIFTTFSLFVDPNIPNSDDIKPDVPTFLTDMDIKPSESTFSACQDERQGGSNVQPSDLSDLSTCKEQFSLLKSEMYHDLDELKLMHTEAINHDLVKFKLLLTEAIGHDLSELIDQTNHRKRQISESSLLGVSSQKKRKLTVSGTKKIRRPEQSRKQQSLVEGVDQQGKRISERILTAKKKIKTNHVPLDTPVKRLRQRKKRQSNVEGVNQEDKIISKKRLKIKKKLKINVPIDTSKQVGENISASKSESGNPDESAKKPTVKRRHLKVGYCYYCKKLFKSQISKHYLQVHRKESEVQQILLLPIGTIERKKALRILLNKGNFKHNAEVLKLGVGNFVTRSRSHSSKAKDYKSCTKCFAFVKTKQISQHQKHCPALTKLEEKLGSNQEPLGSNLEPLDTHEQMFDCPIAACDESNIEVNSVTINPLDENTKKPAGKKRPIKIDCCYYCKKSFKSQISKHYLLVHQKESEVQQILQLPIGSIERKKALRILLNKGNFYHNTEVLKLGKGDLITVKQLKGPTDKHYVPCTKCFAFVKEKQISQHQKHCPATKGVEQTNALRLGKTMLSSLMPMIEEDNPEVLEIFEKMKETSKYPEIRSVCKNDPLIFEYCKSLVGRLTESHEQRQKDKENIRTKLRHLARLLLLLNNDEVDRKDLSFYITAANFDKVVKMVKLMSDEAASPSLAVLMRNHLKHICILKKCIGIRLKDETLQKEAEEFESLCWDASTESDLIFDNSQSELITYTKLKAVTLEQLYENREDFNSESSNPDLSSMNSSENKRRIKIDCCYYCKKSFKSQISKHYLLVHQKESEVQQILQLQMGSIERKNALRILLNKGNFYHNTEVLKLGAGKLITVKQHPGSTSEEYVPCTKCFAFVKKKQISQHQRHCPATKGVEERNALRLGKTMLSSLIPVTDGDNPEVLEIFEKMKETSKYPEIKSVCKNDPLIFEYCKSLVGRLSESLEQRQKDKDNIRTKLRHLARLLLLLNNDEVDRKDLSFYITAANFDKVVKMVKLMSDEAASPSLAVLMRNHLKHICILKKCIGIRLKDETLQKEAEEFESLCWDVSTDGDSTFDNSQSELITCNNLNVDSTFDNSQSELITCNNLNVDTPKQGEVSKEVLNFESSNPDLSSTKSTGKKRRIKIDCCYYCKKSFQSQISKHYLQVHQKESEVQQILQLPIGSVERKKALRVLLNKGNFYHNAEVLRHGKGDLILVKSGKGSTDKKYLPCTKCFAFVKEKQIYQHQKCCPATNGVEERSALRLGKTMLSSLMPMTDENNPEVIEIFEKMKENSKYPGVRSVCKNDPLIFEYCKSLVGRLTESQEQRQKDKDNIRSKLRQLAKLLLLLNDDEVDRKDLSFYIAAANFDKVVKMVKLMSDEAASPSLAVLMRNHLKHICILKKCIGIRLKDETSQKEAEEFESLFKTHCYPSVGTWNSRESELSIYYKPRVIPSTQDLTSLAEFLVGRIQDLIKQELEFEDWTMLAKIVLLRTILFNKQQVAEVEAIKIEDYENRIEHGMEFSEEIMESLSVTEQLLAHRMDLIQLRGRGKCFILLTADMQAGIKHLLLHRAGAGIKEQNPYLFARKSLRPLGGCQVLRDVTKLCQAVRRPDLMTSSGLRKYLATINQILDMSTEELTKLGDHVKDTLNIQTDIVSLHSSIGLKNKLAHVLVARENGHVLEYSGKDLKSISLADMPVPLDADKAGFDGLHGEDSQSCQPEGNNKGAQLLEENSKPNEPLKTGSFVKKKWTKEEEDILQIAFESCFREKRNVSVREIQEAKSVHPILNNRSDAVIRSKINNILLGKVRISVS